MDVKQHVYFSLAPKHARKHETHPPREKKFRLDSNDCGLICAGANFVGGYKLLILFELFVTNLLLFERQQKTAR